MFCAACGHVVKAEDKFCDRCGSAVTAGSWNGPVLASVPGPARVVEQAQPVSAPPRGPSLTAPVPAASPPPVPPALPQPSVVPPRPQPSVGPPPSAHPAPAGTPTWVIVLIGCLLVGVLAGGGWLAFRVLKSNRLAQSTPTPTPTPTSSTPTPTPTSTSTPTSTETPKSLSQFLPGLLSPEKASDGTQALTDFTGSWKTEEPSAGIIVFRLEDESLVADLPEEKAQVRLSRLQAGDSVLHGSYSREGGESIPATAELSSDGKRLTITLAPPQSEFERVVLVRAESGGYEGIEGIEAIDRTDPTSYLPLMSLQLTYRVHYPDGDSGTTRIVSTQLGDDYVRSQLEVGTSELYPGEPNTSVVHYALRNDGLHELEGSDDMILLPARTVPGATWTTQGWDCRVREDGTRLDLGFVQLECLVVERRSEALGVSQTLWFAPGYGKVLVKDGGAEAMRLTATELLPSEEAERQVRAHLP